MKFFIDTANLAQIREAYEMGVRTFAVRRPAVAITSKSAPSSMAM